jgi:RHS repeat-associated protein
MSLDPAQGRLEGTLPVVVSDTEAVYLYGLDIIAQQQAERLYYFHDGLGSVRQMLDSTGEVQTNYAYDPFGVPVVAGDGSNPYQFTGEAWDGEVELLYLRARYYQPEVGRFITKDPWGGDTQRPATLNRYVYVTNNPINRRDPTGRQEIQPTPTPTERETRTMQCLEELQERERRDIITGPASCRIPDVLRQVPRPELTAMHPGIGLLRRRTIVSPKRSVSFWVQYAELVPGYGYRVAIAGGEVRHGVELTVEVYLNGTYVDIHDSYDTTQLGSLGYGLAFPPTLARWARVFTNRGATRGALAFTDQWRVRERFGISIGPWSIGGGYQAVDPWEGLPSAGEKGRGWVGSGFWFTTDEGLPYIVRIYLGIPELVGGMPCGAFSYSVTRGPIHSYDVHLGDI